jgi:hypothetical protein
MSYPLLRLNNNYSFGDKTVLKQWLLLNVFLVSSLFASGYANARELALAFENTLRPSTSLDAMARSQMLIRNLATAGVPQAMFLIKTKGLDQKDKARLALYSNKGHLLVNAGHGHSLVTKSTLYAYEVGILKANRILRPYKGYKKHVHFSYLHECSDINIQRGLAGFLQARGYQPAFTGVNPLRGVDQYIDQLYQQKIKTNRPVKMAELESAYVDLIAQSLNEQDAQAFNVLGYSPKQVLVIQENDIAAYFIVALVDRLVEQGWTIVAAEHLLNDPLINPIAANRWGANGYLNSITQLADECIAYPRVMGARQKMVDQYLERRSPGFVESVF